MYYAASTFEVVLSIVLMITVIVVYILLSILLFKRIVKKKAIEVIQKTPLEIKVIAGLLMLLGLPELVAGILLAIIGGLMVTSYGYLALFFFLSGFVLAFLGVVSLFVGIGLWRLNYAAWKGAIILLIIYTFTSLVPGINSLYLIPAEFFPFLWSIDYNLRLMLPYLFGVCYLGLLIYLYSRREVFLESKVSMKVKKEPEIHPVVSKEPGTCPVCDTKNKPDTQYCVFCGFDLMKKNKTKSNESQS